MLKKIKVSGLTLVTAIAVFGLNSVYLYAEDHGGEIFYTKPATSVRFDHKSHIDMGMDCDSCHEGIFEYAKKVEGKPDFNMKGLYDGKYCGACHDGSTAFAVSTQCDACHTVLKNQIIFSKPAKAVIFDHKGHIDMGNSCDSCHEQIFPSTKKAEEQPDYVMKSLYEGKYCGACHDGKTAFASDTKCNSCHIGVKGYNRMYKVSSGEHKKGGH